ncbi:MAG: FixH family protein [Proteobacteria bacterium]|nr:FixH family protein [Pseudomonadota bacterium]
MQKKYKVSASKIPYIFFAFFGIVIAVNICYIYLAKTTWRGITTDESYQKGLDYNATLEQAEKQKKLGWKVDVKSSIAGDNKMRLSVILLDEKSYEIKDAAINISFRNPVQDGYDFSEVADTSGGSYLFNVTFPKKGQWDAMISIHKGKDSLYLMKRYVVQ